MNDDATRAIARVESHTVRAAEATVAHDHEPPKHPATAQPHGTHAHPIVSAPHATDLSYQPDPESEHILVQIVDRETGSVVRSFSLDLPGADNASDEEPARGALVDAKV